MRVPIDVVFPHNRILVTIITHCIILVVITQCVIKGGGPTGRHHNQRFEKKKGDFPWHRQKNPVEPGKKEQPRRDFMWSKPFRKPATGLPTNWKITARPILTRPIKNGKALVTDLKKAPRKTLSAWIDDGKETITDLNKETRRR
jgi:hypothetical protein